MKKRWIWVALCLLLTGCGARETFETVADEPVAQVSAPLRQIILELPGEAMVPASESREGTIYLCDGYEIILQTLEAGNLEATVKTVSGYDMDNLTLLQTNPGDYKRYDMVWSMAGEEGQRIGRGAILDDGSYHYVLCVLADADRVEELEDTWANMFCSYTLGPY